MALAVSVPLDVACARFRQMLLQRRGDNGARWLVRPFARSLRERAVRGGETPTCKRIRELRDKAVKGEEPSLGLLETQQISEVV